MSTRSLTYVYDETDPILCMYRQSDGYPAGMGKDLFDFLIPFKLVNGLSLGEDQSKIANGAGCLAAQLVAHFKEGAGGIYLYPIRVNQDAGQDYEFHISINGERINIQVLDGSPTRINTMHLFRGTLAEFGEWLTTQE